jgi:hypothetical protein
VIHGYSFHDASAKDGLGASQYLFLNAVGKLASRSSRWSQQDEGNQSISFHIA